MAITRRPQSSRSPSLLLAGVRVLFVNHGRIGTACSEQWHTGPAGVGATEAGAPNRRQGQRENLGRSHTARIWANVRAPVRFGPPRIACSKQWHTVSGPARASRGTRAFGEYCRSCLETPVTRPETQTRELSIVCPELPRPSFPAPRRFLHCLFQAVAHGFGSSAAEQGHERQSRPGSLEEAGRHPP